jgi:soluble lytic murein transglycosylase-like protein
MSSTQSGGILDKPKYPGHAAMKQLVITLALLIAQAAQARENPESIIKLQVKSLDRHTADTVHQGGIADAAEAQWVAKTEQKLQLLMLRSKKLAARLQNTQLRLELLLTIYYEAKRAGLDPDLVLAVIQVESNFRKYAISSAGARGYMQAMEWWAGIVGEPSSDLFNVKTNLRLGCAILRSYLDKEKGNVHRALARYNGSLGRNGYPNLIYAAWR